MQCRFEQGSGAVMRDQFQRFGQERAHQHAARFGARNAAADKIEKLIASSSPYRGAVAAFHVVGVDFQLRLAVDFRRGRQQQRLVHLVAVGFLG